MSREREQEIKRIARQSFGVTGEIDPELRARIERKYILSQGDEAPSSKYRGKTHAERMDAWKRSERRAEEELRQREAINNPQPTEPETLTAKRLRVELAESKLRNITRADPQRRSHLQRELEEARAELAEEKTEKDRQAVETSRREYLASDPHYKRAMDHSEAGLRLAKFKDEGEQVETIMRHKMLERAEPETAKSVLAEYWAAVDQAEQRQVLAEQAKAVEENKQASQAVAAANDQCEKVIEAQHRAEQARMESQS